MQNTCTDQQSLEGESSEVFRHTLSFHTLEGSEDLLDSREAWTDSSKHHILCRHFELKLEAETWKAIPGLWMQPCPLPCTGASSSKHNIPPHSLPSAPCSSSHLPSSTFPGHCSALQPSTTPGPHRLTLHVPLYPTSLTAPPDKVIPATTPCLLPGKKNIWVLTLILSACPLLLTTGREWRQKAGPFPASSLPTREPVGLK